MANGVYEGCNVMLLRMADRPPESAATADLTDSGLSQFGARVLGQLSLSAWLPAALLTLVGALVVQFAAQSSIDLGEAIASLTRDKWTVVLLILPLLVISTLVTQAFSFEAIRTLEGYWHRGGLIRVTHSRLTRRQLARKRKVHEQRMELSHRAFLASRKGWLDVGFSMPLVNAMERQSLDLDPLDSGDLLNDVDVEKLQFLNWRTRCSPVEMSRIYYLSRVEEDYPADHRLLPTRLGNIMRATEDRLMGGEDDVEGFALRHRPNAHSRVQLQHDQFRTRLDMYCTLFFVAGFLSILTPLVLGIGVLGRTGWPISEVTWTAAMTAGLVALLWASYGAAIASARGYLTALVHMDSDPQPSPVGPS